MAAPFTFLALCFATLTVGCAGAQTSLPAQRPTTPFDNPGRVQLLRNSSSVPLEKAGPFFQAPVTINGKPYRFTIETGANHSAISARAAEALGLNMESVNTEFGAIEVVRIRELQIGDALFSDVVARVNPSWTGDFDGIISVPLLRSLRSTLDFPNRRLVFENFGSPSASNGGEILPLLDRQPGSRFDVNIGLGGLSLPAVIDTRSSFFLIAPDSLLTQLTLVGSYGETIRARGPSLGAFSLKPAKLVGSITLGRTRIDSPTVHFRDRPGVVLGMPLLEQFAVTIDYRAGTVTFVRSATASQAGSLSGESAPQRRVTLGFGLIPGPGGRKTVTAVVPEASAGRAGIKEGDDIVSINGILAADINPSVLRTLYSRETPIHIVVLRDGVRHEFQVTVYTER